MYLNKKRTKVAIFIISITLSLTTEKGLATYYLTKFIIITKMSVRQIYFTCIPENLEITQRDGVDATKLNVPVVYTCYFKI